MKESGVWEEIPAAAQKACEEIDNGQRAEVAEKMAHARSKRKKKYTDMPEYLECACGKKVKAYLQKKADAKCIPLMDLVKGYQCQGCNPTKGRRKNRNKDLICPRGYDTISCVVRKSVQRRTQRKNRKRVDKQWRV